MDGEDQRSDDVDGWTDPPGDADAGGPPAEFVDTPEGETAPPGETPAQESEPTR